MERVCPNCSKSLSYSSIYKLRAAERLDSWCRSCNTQRHIGRKRSASTCKLISDTKRGLRWSEASKTRRSHEYTGRKLSSAHCSSISKGLKGKQKSVAHRMKLKEARIAELKATYGQIFPNYNKSACAIFDQLNLQLGLSGAHAENGGEVQIGVFWLDFYDANRNLVIEYDEVHHKYRKQKDIIKESFIKDTLKCKFLRINETDDFKTILTKVKGVL